MKPKTKQRQIKCPPADSSAPLLMDVDELANSLRCSPRHVHALVKSGELPAPIRLGVLVRWPRILVERWISKRCVL